jgi:hypothetical protein
MLGDEVAGWGNHLVDDSVLVDDIGQEGLIEKRFKREININNKTADKNENKRESRRVWIQYDHEIDEATTEPVNSRIHAFHPRIQA